MDGVLDAYRKDLTPKQIEVLLACARALPPGDWEGIVELVLLAQILARPDTRRSDLTARTHSLRTRPFAHLLVSL
jgi:hypothetical protein